MRARELAAVLLFVQATGAVAASTANYYGPMRSGQGYKEKSTKDGYWEIQAATKGRRMHSIDVALYRAAELARTEGSRFVEIHDVYSAGNSLGDERATLFARATSQALHPKACRSGKQNRCYTADVAIIMKRLGGASGNEPGITAPSYIDKYGRAVREGGYGTGAITALAPVR